ncbi:hypothetical protein Tco_0741941, partial [Tanacetum coccineum]
DRPSPYPDYVPGLEHPPSPDYVPGPEEPEQAPLSPDYPLLDDASPTALSPGYVAESDSEEDPEEDPVEYPADRGVDDDDDKEDEEEEEEEHLAPVDSTALLVVDPVSSDEDTEALETDEFAPTPPKSPRLRRVGISVRPQTLMAESAEALIIEYAAAPKPPSLPPSPLTPLSSLLPQIPSPPLPLPSPPTHTSPTYDDAPLGYRAVGIRLRAASPSTHHPSEIPSPPLLLPSTSHRDDIPKVDMPLRKRARFTTPAFGFEVEESSAVVAARQPGLDVATVDATYGRPMSREVGYGIEDVWDD